LGKILLSVVYALSLINALYEFPAGGPGAAEKSLHAKLRAIDDAFLVRLCTVVALGFAIANIFGDVVREDLVSAFLQVSSAQPLISARALFKGLPNDESAQELDN